MRWTAVHDVGMLCQVEGPPGQPKTLYNSSKHQEFKLRAKDVGNLISAQIRIVSGSVNSPGCGSPRCSQMFNAVVF